MDCAAWDEVCVHGSGARPGRAPRRFVANCVYSLSRWGEVGSSYIVATFDNASLAACLDMNMPCYDAAHHAPVVVQDGSFNLGKSGSIMLHWAKPHTMLAILRKGTHVHLTDADVTYLRPFQLNYGNAFDTMFADAIMAREDGWAKTERMLTNDYINMFNSGVMAVRSNPRTIRHVLSIPVAAATRLIAGHDSEGQMARDGIVHGALRDASYLGSTRHVRRLFSDCYGSEETAVAAAAVRVAAAAVDGVSLPVCLAMNLVRFVHDVSGRDRPAGGGVVSASFLNAKPAVGDIGVEPRRGGVPRVLFTVASDAVADTVVRSRRNLRDVDPSAGVFDVLSDREEAQHRALWPAFLAAKAAGKRAQFHCARLVVDGERVAAPVC
ncbi:hypothetical protein FOA52_002463 [Chlamydomonas sp. UWO 241]|nr:hypothetical protein FOA52_002463 [Chlamydomonas sp. UWO 241]